MMTPQELRRALIVYAMLLVVALLVFFAGFAGLLIATEQDLVSSDYFVWLAFGLVVIAWLLGPGLGGRVYAHMTRSLKDE